MAVLYLPFRESGSTQALKAAARERGLDVVRIGGPKNLVGGPAHFYGGPRLAERIAGAEPLALLEPDDGWLPSLPERFLGRSVRLCTVAEARQLPGSWFVKTPREKDFEAGVHDTATLPLDDHERVLVSEVVEVTTEWRFWLLDGAVHAASSHRAGDRPEARALSDDDESRSVLAFVASLLEHAVDTLPSAVVVDVGWLAGDRPGWAVVEANPAWYSSLHAADPARVLDVVLRASGPPEAVLARDRRFVRV